MRRSECNQVMSGAQCRLQAPDNKIGIAWRDWSSGLLVSSWARLACCYCKINVDSLLACLASVRDIDPLGYV